MTLEQKISLASVEEYFISAGMMGTNLLIFFLCEVLCLIIFISTLITILQHIKVLPFVIKLIIVLLTKVNDMKKLKIF
ncbi:MAG: hypothetical protein ACTS85_02440 [Arsenophonus sp. NC-PG7-MAG3]